MKRLLLATTAIVAFAAQVQFGRAADAEPVGYADFPTTFISFEGGYYFDASPNNVSFDNEDGKLGDLGSLMPGAGGAQGRFELGQRLNENWDYKVGFSVIMGGSDSSRADYDPIAAIVGGLDGLPEEAKEDLEEALGGTLDQLGIELAGKSRAKQKTNLQLLDVEVGYRPDDLGPVQARVFGGVRGLHVKTELDWDSELILSLKDEVIYSDTAKVGEFNDEVFALGPRIGVDLAVPLNTEDIALVGSASGSLLFGNIDSESGSRDWDDTQTMWNVEGMAGVSFGVGENADFTLGYRVAQFGDVMVDRSDIDKTGDFSGSGHSDLLLHGPFARLTVEIP